MKGLAWSSLSLSLMSWASASSKMPPFNLLATDSAGGVTFNRWLVTGNSQAKCYTVSIGEYRVDSTGEKTLRVAYSGEEGIWVTSSKSLQYDYLHISISCCDPVVIQQWTPIPNEAARIGLFVLFYELSHPTLGQGAQQGFFQTKCGTEMGLVLFVRMGMQSLPFHLISIVLTGRRHDLIC